MRLLRAGSANFRTSRISESCSHDLKIASSYAISHSPCCSTQQISGHIQGKLDGSQPYLAQTSTSAPTLCRIHHPNINYAVGDLRSALRNLQVHPYNELQGTGELRYVQLTVANSAPWPARDPADAQVQLVLVWNNAHATPTLTSLAESLWSADQQRCAAGKTGLWHSIWANFQTSRSNTILSEHWSLLYGPEQLWQHVGGVDICLGPGSFAQANPGAMSAALDALAQWVPQGSTVLDLHAGVGTIGLSLLARDRCSKLQI
ncbi:hypothetical protein WJX73_000405 [Symbiochloris irregularis]|uniref:Uncharacterized protein n=1 Tax=Symbiochloris irregularis TaxID=706552 RepID=A0AAW1NRQ4_9CHLO